MFINKMLIGNFFVIQSLKESLGLTYSYSRKNDV